MFFLEFPCFLYDTANAIWSLVPLSLESEEKKILQRYYKVLLQKITKNYYKELCQRAQSRAMFSSRGFMVSCLTLKSLINFEWIFVYDLSSCLCCWCCSVAQSHSMLWDPMDCRTPGFPVLHHLTELAQTNKYPLSWWCHPSILSSVIPFSCLQSFPASGSFLMHQLFTSGEQSIGISLSASVLLMNIQDWFPLWLTGCIPLQPKRLSRVFSNAIVLKYQFFGAQPSLWSNSHIHTWLLEKP